MKIYRFEHEDDGMGPFRCKKYTKDSDFEPFREHSAPSFFKEFDDFVENQQNWRGLSLSTYIFGMQSIDALYDLLVYTPEKMQECGFSVVVYEVDEDFLCFPDGQVMFNKEKAKKLVEQAEMTV